jgi:cell division protein FtsW (lipid II flippase)
MRRLHARLESHQMMVPVSAPDLITVTVIVTITVTVTITVAVNFTFVVAVAVTVTSTVAVAVVAAVTVTVAATEKITRLDTAPETGSTLSSSSSRLRQASSGDFEEPGRQAAARAATAAPAL